jgi:hypothetical protein
MDHLLITLIVCCGVALLVRGLDLIHRRLAQTRFLKRHIRELIEREVRTEQERQDKLYLLKRALATLQKSYDASRNIAFRRNLAHSMIRIREQITALTPPPPSDGA